MTLYTIGHSNMTIDTFVGLLHSVSVEVLVDVRTSPYSKYASQFNKDALIESLPKVGIRYVYMGDSLGGRPSDKSCYIGELPDYDLIRQKDFYKKGIERLLNGITHYRIAIMCSEEDPLKCHRRNLIAMDLHKIGIEIIHIRANGALETDEFLVEDKEVQQTFLF